MPFLFEGLSASFSTSVDKQWKKAFEQNRGTIIAPRKRATADYWITSDKENDDEAEDFIKQGKPALLAAWIYNSISNRALQNPFSYLYVDEALTDAIYPQRERLPAREPVPEGTVVVEDSRHVGSKRLEYRREDEIEWLKNLMERAEGSEEVLSQRRDSEDPARFARLGGSGSAGVSGSQKKRESSQKNKEAGEASESQKSKKKPKANWFLEQETPEPVAEPIVEPAPDPTPEPAPEPMEMDNGGSAEENQAEEEADVRRSPRKSAKGKERAEERISPPTESQQKQKKRKEREPEPEQREEEPESSGVLVFNLDDFPELNDPNFGNDIRLFVPNVNGDRVTLKAKAVKKNKA